MLDCVVVGGGPAGLTAAMYLCRFERRVAVVDAGASRALRIPCTRNYPGFPQGIAGADLLDRMRLQLREAGGAVTAGRATGLQRRGDAFLVQIDRGPLHTRRVLLATGVVDREPALPGLDAVRAIGRLRNCPVCDGHDFRGARIVVVGHDAHALREAEFLTAFSGHVELIATAAVAPQMELIALARQCGLRWWADTARSLETRGGEVVVRTGAGAVLRADVVYLALGVDPASRLASGIGARLTDSGTIRIDPHGQTSVPGVYAAGDVVDALDQLAVAAGQAAIAATAIHNSLR